MENKLERELRWLKAYTIILSVLCATLVLTAFSKKSGRQKLEEIEAERINIVGKSGQVELVIANKDSLPGPGNIVTGKFGTRQGLKVSGMLFYDNKGNESGGLLEGSREQSGRSLSGSLLTFDKPGGDQVIGIQAEQLDSERKVGFNIWDQPDVSAEQQNKNWDEAQKLPPSRERDALMQEATSQQRVFVGRVMDKSSIIALYDANGRPRLKMTVGKDGQGKIEFLDASGKVVQSLPDTPDVPLK